ncbi:MAG TPA: LON peptidase substrate-binding domain-containing protein, partial [Bryobacteraceae bacterium]|nr:LON peptidase substrate-binding domain-containing protein [Bryobacteraceae bacterium]
MEENPAEELTTRPGSPEPESELSANATTPAGSEIAVEALSEEARPEQVLPEELPILAVRDTVLFPNALLPITVGRPASVALVESLGENRLIGIVSQLDPRTDDPSPTELNQTGTVAIIHKMVRMRDGQLLFCEGVSRMRTLNFTSGQPFLKAQIERLPEVEPEITPELTALRQ